ncbi:hypothetical protein B7C42_01608 [Nocardia cerradoensis]|uniref:Uncharacterized protein n=1 Tax=Nocardia cerradoensis TaxID=85688 RepID=A0A231HCF7_9NOCA|nr:hypothetical protein [Nocardia cerradoensis]OXR46634.1 hypothetical protein B7C42_01608 [Nocardia cerradoensis]
MSAADQHRIKAETALRRLPDEAIGLTPVGAEATAHALLYVGDQLAQLVEQQKLANVIAACALPEDRSPFDWPIKSAAGDYVYGRVGDIVNPATESDPS